MGQEGCAPMSPIENTTTTGSGHDEILRGLYDVDPGIKIPKKRWSPAPKNPWSIYVKTPVVIGPFSAWVSRALIRGQRGRME